MVILMLNIDLMVVFLFVSAAYEAKNILIAMRQHGVRLANAKKNVGKVSLNFFICFFYHHYWLIITCLGALCHLPRPTGLLFLQPVSAEVPASCVSAPSKCDGKSGLLTLLRVQPRVFYFL